MAEHHIDDLIRVVSPEEFSASVHGTGHLLAVSGGKARLYERKLLDRLFRIRSDEVHYFVKAWSVPKEVKEWTFHWSEGTSAISLELQATFVIQANEEHQAMRLAEALHGVPSAPGEKLHGIINASLHQELERMLVECNRKASSLLDGFTRSSAGIGESSELNARVTQAVANTLGGTVFRIGLLVKKLPPMQIEVHQTDPFTLADSAKSRKVSTSALLHLENYQAFMKSGLEDEQQVCKVMGSAITQVVKQLLFAAKYYSVVRSFMHGPDSIEAQMHERIRAEARTIGYRVDMFQSFPDIAALVLLNPLRIDIPAEDEKYLLLNSTGYAQLGIALSVQAERDFSSLHLLVHPDVEDVTLPIAEQVRRTVRDTLRRFDRMSFNLHFEDQIIPAVRDAVVGNLATYGLAAKVIHIVQAPTEDAQRFMAIRGRTIPFTALIEVQAEGERVDDVAVNGKIEVTGLAEGGWERFEAKDFGYRLDSHLTVARLRQMGTEHALALPEGAELPQPERRMLAIDLELIEIRDRAVNAIRESLSKVPHLSVLWRSMANSAKIIGKAGELAEQVVREEFGLSVALRAVRRDSTDAELTSSAYRRDELQFQREQSAHEREHEIVKRKQIDEAALQLLESATRKDRDAIDDEMDPRHEEARRHAQSLQRASERRSPMAAQRLGDVLPPSGAAGALRLPWEKADAPQAPQEDPPASS